MLRNLRRRFGISAPRMAVRTHLPWHWRAAGAIVVIAASLALAGWIYDAGRRFAGFDRGASEETVNALHQRIGALERELDQVRSIANTSEAKLNIEKTAQEQLGSQVKQLESDNARLKEDLAVFENMAQGQAAEGSLNISSLRIVPEDDVGTYRYRLLVAQQAGRKGNEFNGSLQFSLTLQQDGKNVMMVLPKADEPGANRYQISFRHFRRLEGTFKILPAGKLLSVEARLIQSGVVKASQRVSL